MAQVRLQPPPLPDWRITCFYVDKKHRGQGIARAALEGALDQIAKLGSGLVEAIPEVTAAREAHGRFLFSATVELFDQYGFTPGRQVGKQAWCSVAVSVSILRPSFLYGGLRTVLYGGLRTVLRGRGRSPLAVSCVGSEGRV